MLALVDGATASATRQIAVRVRSRMCHSDALKPSVLLLLPFRGALFLQRFLGFLLPLALAVQTLAHGSLPQARCPFGATRTLHPSVPSRKHTPARPASSDGRVRRK